MENLKLLRYALTVVISLIAGLPCRGSTPAPTQLLRLKAVNVDVTVLGALEGVRSDFEREIEGAVKARGITVGSATAPTLEARVTTVPRKCGADRLVALEVTLELRDDVSLSRDPTIKLQERVVTWSKTGLLISTEAAARNEAVKLLKAYVVSFLDNLEWVAKKYE